MSQNGHFAKFVLIRSESLNGWNSTVITHWWADVAGWGGHAGRTFSNPAPAARGAPSVLATIIILYTSILMLDTSL